MKTATTDCPPSCQDPQPHAEGSVSSSQSVDHLPEELARQAQNGSLVAFAQLVGLFEGRLFNFILRRIGNWSDAEELTQETFVRAWERIDRYDSRWRFSTWLFTIGSRLAVSHHRSHRRVFTTDRLECRDSEEPSPIERAEQRESRAPTWELAARILTESQHTALWLRYAEGLSMKEIAYVMGKSQVSVRVTLFRARDQLAQEIMRLRRERLERSGAAEIVERGLRSIPAA